MEEEPVGEGIGGEHRNPSYLATEMTTIQHTLFSFRDGNSAQHYCFVMYLPRPFLAVQCFGFRLSKGLRKFGPELDPAFSVIFTGCCQ